MGRCLYTAGYRDRLSMGKQAFAGVCSTHLVSSSLSAYGFAARVMCIARIPQSGFEGVLP